MLRDGRDVARSRVRRDGREICTRAWNLGLMPSGSGRSLARSFRRGAESRFGMRRWWSDPVPALTKICGFLGLSYDPAMLNYPRDSTYEAPRSRLIGQWRTKLSRRAIQLAEARIAEMLVARSYELSGYPSPANRAACASAALKPTIGSTVSRFRRRLYGTRLFAAELAIRLTEPIFLGLCRIRAQIRVRLHDVERSTLK